MNRTLSFLFAAALGATLGALTALEYAPYLGASAGLAATLGVIVGGLAGYIAVDFRMFWEGAVTAGKFAFETPTQVTVNLKNAVRIYQAAPRDQKTNGLYFAGGLFLIYSYIFISLMYPFLVTHPIFASAFGIFIVSIVLLVGYMVTVYPSTRAISGKSLFYWSTIGIPHSMIFKVLPWLAICLFKGTHWVVRQTGVFLKMAFVAVHSQRRVLCCLDAMLGTLVGYYLGSWPAGTLAGLVFALISYELISKRLLKLQSA